MVSAAATRERNSMETKLLIRLVNRKLVDDDGATCTAKFTTSGALLVSLRSSAERQGAAIAEAIKRIQSVNLSIEKWERIIVNGEECDYSFLPDEKVLRVREDLHQSQVDSIIARSIVKLKSGKRF
jgi:hypothetical protein